MRGGLVMKISTRVDALGNLVRSLLLPGQCNDSVGTAAVIPSKSDRRTQTFNDVQMYCWRHLGETLSCQLKEPPPRNPLRQDRQQLQRLSQPRRRQNHPEIHVCRS